METERKYALGIDLGTTNSVCAIIYEDQGIPVIVTDPTGQRLLPSVFHMGRQIIVGAHAKCMLMTQPEATIYDSKRLIDVNYKEAAALIGKSQFPFQVENEGFMVDGDKFESVSLEVKYQDNDYCFLPEEIAGHLLRRLKINAEEFTESRAITKVVVCVPANFNITQKEATRVGAVLAGFSEEKISLMNEPSAAALAYGAQVGQEERVVLVYDLGGGTFDVTIMLKTDENFIVLATGGSSEVGGQDFDIQMKKLVLNQLKHEYPNVKVPPKYLQKLQAACEAAKISLLALPSAMITLENVLPGGEDFQYEIDREKFEKINQPYFNHTLQIVGATLEEAELGADEIDDIILVGGSTRIPKIQQMLMAKFGKKPVTGVNPDEAVAIGAAINAAMHSKNSEGIYKNMRFLDVAPNHIGAMRPDFSLNILVYKNTKLPYCGEKTFKTTFFNQRFASFVVYEGMHPERAALNKMVGRFVLGPFADGQDKGTEYTVAVSMDSAGLITISSGLPSNGEKEYMKMSVNRKITQKKLADLKLKFEKDCSGIYTKKSWKRKFDVLDSANDDLDDSHVVFLE